MFSQMCFRDRMLKVKDFPRSEKHAYKVFIEIILISRLSLVL